jgi:hypothetical protein
MSDDQNKSVDADDLEYDMARDDEDYFDDGGIETVPADEEPTVRIQDIQDLEDDEDDMSDETGISDISDVTDADDGEDDLIVPGRRAGKAAKSGGAPRKSAMLIVGGVAVLAGRRCNVPDGGRQRCSATAVCGYAGPVTTGHGAAAG